MIDLEHIPELIDELNAGSLSLEDVYFICIESMEKFDVESVLASLPPHLRSGLAAVLFSSYDNDIPVEEFMLFSSARGDNPAKVLIINKIRRWLKLQK